MSDESGLKPEVNAEPFLGARLLHWRVTFDERSPRLAPGMQPSDPWGVCDDGWPEIRRDGNILHIIFCGTCRFRVDTETREILVCDIVEGTLENDLAHLLNDHVAPRLLAHSGLLVLHGSAVDCGGVMAIFLGETGAGKSTLALSLDQAGYRLLGDDAVIVEPAGDAGFVGEPVYPSLRLFPESISALVGTGAVTAPMAGYSEKRLVRLARLDSRAGERLPVAALFFLDDGDAAHAPDPVATPAHPTNACIALVEQSFAMDPFDPASGAQRLSACSGLAQALPCFTLSYPREYGRLPEVHALIMATLKSSLLKSEHGGAR